MINSGRLWEIRLFSTQTHESRVEDTVWPGDQASRQLVKPNASGLGEKRPVHYGICRLFLGVISRRVHLNLTVYDVEKRFRVKFSQYSWLKLHSSCFLFFKRLAPHP